MNYAFLLGVSALAGASAASAQDVGGWTADTIVVTGVRESYAEPQAATATRTATPIEQVPQSIQVLTRSLIDEQQLKTLTDALVNVSGVVPSSTAQTVLQPTLVRGFSVNYFFDGTPSYQLPPSAADPGTLVNVERIEVAKGPTATLYGGGAGAPLSGIINLVSKDPTGEWSASLAGRAGSFGTVGAEADLNVPLGDIAAFRVATAIESGDSYIDFVSRDRFAVFPTLLLNLGEDTRLIVRGRYTKLRQTEYTGVPYELLEPEALIDRNVYAGARDMPRTSVENKAITATLNHSFSDKVEASATFNRTNSKFDEWGTFPYGQIFGTVYNFGSAWLPTESKKTFASGSVTARFGEGTIRQQWLVGADYDHTDYFGAMYFNPVWGVVDYANPLPAQPFGGPPPLYFDQKDRLESIALFAQDQISIGDRLDVTLGLRWTKLKIRSAMMGMETDTSDSKFTPRVGATFRIADGLSLFGGYSEGFQGVVGAAMYGITPKPETSQHWEGGLKFAGVVKGLTGTAALYQLTRQNVLTPDPTNPFLYVQTGEQRAQGAELDLVYEPNANLSLLFNYAYTDAKVRKDNNLPVGDRLRAVPEHSGRLAARYRVTDGALSGLGFGAGVTAMSSRELTLPNTLSVKGAALVDAQASYKVGPATIALSVVNLLGSKSFDPYQYFGGAYVSPTQPRSAFLTLRGDF
jgi:iron complex outermembrane receptor protein